MSKIKLQHASGDLLLVDIDEIAVIYIHKADEDFHKVELHCGTVILKNNAGAYHIRGAAQVIELVAESVEQPE